MTKTKDIWPPLVEEARQGRTDALFDALTRSMRELEHTLGRKPTFEEWPPCVKEFLRESIAPTGRRGRPARSDWECYVIRTLYEQYQFLYALGKDTDGTNEDGSPLLEQPTNYALEILSVMLNKSAGTILDIVYPDRGQRGQKRRKNKPQ